MPVCVGKVQVLSVENLLQVSLQILLYCIQEWRDETHLTDSLTAPPLFLRGGSDGPVSSFQSVGSSVNILPMCRSVEVRDGNVLWDVGFFSFYNSEEKSEYGSYKKYSVGVSVWGI